MLGEHVYFPAAETGFGAGLAFGEPTWYAIHTMARHEKRVTTYLQEERVFAFLPLIDQLHRWSDRRSRVEVPLFGCYVFVRIVPTVDNRLRVLRTPGVLGFVGSRKRGAPIAEQEMESLRTVVRSKAPLETHPFVNTGKRVRIRGGALDGVEGIIQYEGADRSLVLSIELLRRSVSIRVEGYDVELV
jgi:transcription antitermination factor NusG